MGYFHETMYVPALETNIRGAIAKGWPVTFDVFMAHAKADHTPSEDVGRIAQEAGVKTLVLSHLVPAWTASTMKLGARRRRSTSRARSSLAKI
ncbi:hypothetical protein [Bradyrhizobium sp. NAS80.1]|uniref:hypothetical protein n=1 Tax=Bradyrhizobium sp. NAS80.1 TaxID=1680159 RepID=UPI0011612E41|nr:hypothetical protein [Bradyrhizobium sp. NAS80.1]